MRGVSSCELSAGVGGCENSGLPWGSLNCGVPCPRKEGHCVLTSPVTSRVHLSGRNTPDETHPSPQGAFRDWSKCTRKRKVTQMVGREAKETAHNSKWEKVLEGCRGEGVLSWDPRVWGGTACSPLFWHWPHWEVVRWPRVSVGKFHPWDGGMRGWMTPLTPDVAWAWSQ